MKEEQINKALKGAIIAAGYAEVLLAQAIKKHGPGATVAYPGTAYELPTIMGLLGNKVEKLEDLLLVLGDAKSRLKSDLTYENLLLAGELTLYSAEIVEALKYVDSEAPYDEYTGFVSDEVLRKLGLALVDDTMPGIAVIVGKARTSGDAAKIVRDLQEKGILIMLVGDVIEQLEEEDIKMGIDLNTFNLGHFTSAIHSLNFAVRAGLTFGNIPRGEKKKLVDYMDKRVRAFVLALGEQDYVMSAAEAGAVFCGFPVIADQEIEEMSEKYVHEPDYDKLVKRALEVRGIKIKLAKVPVPIPYSPAFEGERLRKPDAYLEAGNGKSPTFELVRMKPLKEVEDRKIELIGPDLKDMKEGSESPLAIIVDVAGRKMLEDFEPVLERRIHYFLNYGMGLWHVAQRDLVWIRISKEAFQKGLSLRDLGTILHTKFNSEYPSIVDRVQVTIITDEKEVKKRLPEARNVYAKRNARVKDMTDEKVDTFYSCTLCQSFAPNHVCIVTPERLGLCGGINWLDARAGHEITPEGPNQPIKKGQALDPVKGQWKEVNDFISDASHRNLDKFNLYSLMDLPMTSCGCFECVIAILPEANGVMLVNREYQGETPCGMKFSTLAGSVGGGMQNPGFMGIGKQYILSKKFMSAEGGLKRVVWMPKELKEMLRDELAVRAKDIGVSDLLEKIADETVATTLEELLPFLEKVQHPALEMEPML